MKKILRLMVCLAGLGGAVRAAEPVAPDPAPAPSPAAKAGPLGAGIILGIPFGVTAKYWLDDRLAVAGAFGVSDGNADAHADVVMHFDNALPKSKAGRLPVYAGVGMKIKSENRTFFGLRFIGGVSVFLTRRPLELFAEIAPVLRLAPSEGAAVDGGAGVRYYF